MKKATFIDSLQFIKTLTSIKIINGIMLRLSYSFSRVTGVNKIWGNPESLSIEPTNLCNLKCPECPSGNNRMTRSRLFLSINEYKNIIDQSYQHVSFLQLYFQGEPFMHPHIYDFIKYSCQHNIYTSTSTNGQFLNRESVLKIIESGLHRLIISIDGTNQEVYSKYRIGGSYEKLIDGIKLLTHLKKEKKSKTPHIIIQFVVLKSNEHQIGEIKELAKNLQIDSLKIKSAQIEDFKNGNEMMTTIDKYSRYKKTEKGFFVLKRKQKFKCRRVWNGVVISASNEVLPCCFDKNGSHSYGSLKNHNLTNIIRNSLSQQFRNEVWQSNIQHEICRNCTEGIKKTWF
jgi:radical SAM protein with 4Fe4S-binding SPASM domain